MSFFLGKGTQKTSEEASWEGGGCLEILQHFKEYQGPGKASTVLQLWDSGPPRVGRAGWKVGKVVSTGTESKKD